MRADTIFALSTAPGRSAIAVVRISGPRAANTIFSMTGRVRPLPSRQATLVNVRDGEKVLDRALCLFFAAPNSVTGEDLVELHIHGGPAVIRSVLAVLGRTHGLRMAEPGEFTRRSFQNGKLDLTQAEGLADLIDAETEMQAAQALSQMDGRLGQLYGGWRQRVVKGLAYLEAVIDFPDEDVPDSAALAILPDLESLKGEISAHLADGNRGEILRDGLSAVLLGAPNSGKSSLMNSMARREVAIVSDIAGTTRDVLEARLNIQGYAVNLADTAGLRETSESIESEGIRRALSRAEHAHVRVLLADPESVQGISRLLPVLRPGDLVVWSKADLNWTSPDISFESIRLSTLSGLGLDAFTNWLGRRAASLAGQGGAPLITRSRHRMALEDAQKQLAKSISKAGIGLDVAAEHLRLAAQAIGRITGHVDVEDVLDVVFRDFCIGK